MSYFSLLTPHLHSPRSEGSRREMKPPAEKGIALSVVSLPYRDHSCCLGPQVPSYALWLKHRLPARKPMKVRRALRRL